MPYYCQVKQKEQQLLKSFILHVINLEEAYFAYCMEYQFFSIALWLFAENSKTAKHTNMHDFGLSVAICTAVIGVLYVIQHFLVFVESNHFSLIKDNSQQQIDQWFKKYDIIIQFTEIISILNKSKNNLNQIQKFSITRFDI
ncbi:unnamed protein product (macronuclear) [Paramecium tetraurelia]|uniref:Transmembrane protein n=1 Tax=Paramecium tetraurelia TaxID=5888 RepID=A0D4L3_PARTE|nr:uncharacterized protein GSPATT00039257001 [Paramecium tetraurelia]CAK77980.1 unnamed protein product [Paramecium tetraurelia]|eukprot:XP_001445377.1 hypothetical protein (macronuclear) [Paramecium tetraurelia strain d4-2]